MLENQDNQDIQDNQNPITNPGKIVNLPFARKEYEAPSTYEVSPTIDYRELFNSTLSQGSKNTRNDFVSIPGSQVPTSDRYPLFFPGIDNEQLYAEHQGSLEKAKNGVIKMVGTASATFVNDTAGLVYGIGKSIKDGKFSSLYNNELTTSVNDWSEGLADTYAHYKTIRERNGNWWEPSNLFTGNFLWENIVTNLGFSLGSAAAGFAWGGALEAIGLTGKLMSTGVKMASRADAAIAEAALLPEIERLPSITSKLNGLWNETRGAIGKGLLKSDQAIVATFGTVGEAGMEAMNNGKQFRENMIAEFTRTHGYAPQGQDLDQINNYADTVANWSFASNVALLSATNYIQLPKIYSSSFKSEKEILNNIALQGEKYVSTLPEKGFGKLLYKSKNIGSLFFNTAEAFEEGAQYAIQTGTQNYFNRKYKGQESSALDDGILYGIKEALTTNEGTLNIFTGGFSGALQSSGILGIKNGLPAIGKTGKIGERGFTGYGGEQAVLRDEAITALNQSLIKDKMKEAYSSIKASEIIQAEREAAIRRGDILESKDLEFDYAHNFITTRLKYNAKTAIDAELNSLKQQASTDAGFMLLQQQGYAAATDTKESFLNRLNNIQDHANNTAALYEAVNLKYKGLLNKETGEPIYTQDVLDKMVYAAAKVADYDKRAPKLSEKLLANGVGVADILNDVVNNEVPSEEAIKEALAKIDNLKSTNVDDLKTDLRDIVELGLRRKQFLDEYNQIKNNPQEFKEEAPVEEKEIVPGETIVVTTKDGEEEIPVGEEYFLGKVVEYDAKGNEVYRFPRLTILGENEDGTIQIKTSTGEIKNVSKDVLADYKLGKVSDTLNDKKAKFFLENINTVFQFNFGKGNKVNGRLTYSPKDRVLNFVYKDKRSGKIKSIEVTGDQFKAQEGYKEAMITPVMKLSAAQQETLDSYSEEKDDRLQAKREARLKILNDLYDELSESHDKTTSLINKKQEEVTKIKAELSEIEKQIANAEVDKRAKNSVRFKSTTKKALENAMRLSRTQDQLERELEKLQTEKDEIEFNLAYVSDIASNIDELPTGSEDFIEELNNQVLDLEILQEKTGKQISLVSSLLKETEKALNTAIDFVNDLISKFESKYPNVPRIMGQDYVDFLKANPNFLKLKPNYREDLADIEDLIGNVEEGDVVPNENRLKELDEHLSAIQEDLKELQKEIVAKQLVLDRFEEIAERYKQQQAEAKRLQTNESLRKQLLGTLDNSVQNNPEPTKSYEAASKKSDLDVVGSTVAPSGTDANKPFNKRAQKFGAKLASLPNSESIRGIVVTANTEDQILRGLTDHLVKGSDANPKTVIAMVMVAENPDGTYYLVNENGEAIPEGADLLNSAVYQVFPLGEKSRMEKMFRESTPQDVKNNLIDQYSAWRNSQLEQTTLGVPEKISASFGIPQYVEIATDKSDKNGKPIMERDYSARTSAEAAGLITPSMLKSSKLITVATTNESISNGSVTFSTPLGRVFLQVPGGLVKLFNRKFNNKEANTIFDVVKQLSSNIIEDGKVTDRSTRLINWLKSTTYWGIAKDPQTKARKEAGYNNIWFEEVLEDNKPTTKLFISGRGAGFNFDPISLEDNKGEILALLEGMYNNTNATLANDNSYTNSYIEIIGIDESGEPITKTWENYQTYLLSSEGRTANEIPLTTQFRPLSSPEDVNREGIYFKFNNTIDRFNTVPTTPKIVEKPQEKVTPVAETKQEVPTAPAKTEGFDLNGEAENTVTIGRFGDTTFKLNAKEYLDSNGTKGFEPFFKGTMVEAIMSQLNKTEDEAKALIGAAIIQKVQPQLDAMALPKFAPMEEFTEEENDDWDNSAFEAPDDKVYRLQLAKEAKQFENFDQVEAWLKEKLPNIPVYRVKNVIQATNGKQAWGMFQNGAIYIYENAGSGTAYHEVFEAVWKMFTSPEERQAIIKEFRSRAGSYTDRFTGETVKYSEATDAQLKEEIAEEFTDFKLYGKEVAAPEEKSLIKKLFKDILNFIKEFFTGKAAASNTQELFNKIESGYYARYNPYETSLSVGNAGIISIDAIYAGPGAEYRLSPIDVDSLVKKIPAKQLHDVLQHMTYKTLATLVENKKSLFKLPSKTELYKMLKSDILNTLRWQGAQHEKNAEDARKINDKQGEEFAAKRVGDLKDLYRNINSEWDSIVQKHEQHLMSYSITFSEDDNAIIGDQDKSGKGDYQDSRKIDTFKKANAAVKLMVAAVPNVTVLSDNTTKFKRTSEGFISLAPSDVIFASLMNELQTSVSIDDMLTRLRTLALGNPNYRSIYERLTGKVATTPGVTITNAKKHDISLISAFWKTFKKQNPDVISVFILPSGEVVIGDGSLASASRQAKRELNSSIVAAVKKADLYFKYDPSKKIYSATSKLQGVKLDRSRLGTYIDFLKNLNIDFTESDLRTKLNDNQLKTFLTTTEGLLKSLSKVDEVKYISSKSLDIDGRLLELGTIKSIIENPQFELTYFNADGERVQSSIGVNAMSNLYDALSKVNNINDLATTPYAYLLTDVFSKGSEVLNKIFDVEGDGRKKQNSEYLLKPSFIDSTINEQNGRVKDQSKYQYKDRIIQEININLNGVYSNLVPGDASIGWTQRLHNPESPFVTEDELLNNEYFKILRNHFISEVNLARDGRNVLRDGDKLRFFRDILGKELADDITSRKNININPEDLFDGSEYNGKIKSAISKFITDSATDTLDLLYNYGIVYETESGLVAPGLAISTTESVTEEELNRKLKLHAINYMIANMELHKLLYSDPYQYENELKRVKSFSSPRQALVALSSDFNNAAHKAYNEEYKEGDLGYTDFTRDFFKSATIDDVFSTDDVTEEYIKPFEETDGGGYIISKANRVYGIHVGDWTEENELQHAYDIAYEKIVKGEGLSDEEKSKRGLVLNDQEKKFEIKKITTADGSVIYRGKNPNVKSTYTPRKPIVTGSKLSGRGYNDIVLDKFALVPISFRVLHELNPNSNAIKLYNKMQKEDVDYAVFKTGRKVGAEKITSLYNPDGSFNETPFQTEQEKNNPSLPQGVLNIPFHIMGLQSEVPSKDEPVVTQGTQVTEMVTMDFLQAGVPIDFKPEITDPNERFAKWNATEDKEAASPLFKEIKNNQNLLRAKVVNGVNNLMTKLGITEVQKKVEKNGKLVTKKSFEISDPEKLVDALYSEVIKSGVNDNILYALNGLKFGKVVLEATPAYQYIRNLLFSLADKQIASQKVRGGQKIQVPSSLLESERVEGKEFKDKKGNKKMSYSSKDLKFYKDKDGERVCEIMVARWFDSNMSDEELLNYFNNTEEGQKILKGVAFRIPTQKQNSIDTFKIKKFLPEGFGDSVVIPSALVKKVGSDFDIDKLFIYFKNVYKDGRGDIKYVPFFGIGEQAKAKFADMFDRGEFLTEKQTKELDKYVAEEMEREFDLDSPEAKLIRDIFPDAFTEEAYAKEFVKNLTKNGGIRQAVIDRKYTESLENEYFESLQRLISHPLNFERLVKPNSADQLKELANKIVEATGQTQLDSTKVGNMLSFGFMTKLRQAFIGGKRGVGIAASGQKNHSQNQRAFIYVDADKLKTDLISDEDKKFLGDGKVYFEKYNKLNGKPTLSFIKDADNVDFISDINGQFVDGYVDISNDPWIMKLGATPNVASTWLFLIKLGVPIDTVAYFMNQPIVRDYLRTLESNGYSWLFIEDFISDTLDNYSPSQEVSISQIPSEKTLEKTLGKKSSDMTDQEKAQQQFILTEFIKYSKMASHLYEVSQGSNFDTATINDSLLVFKKILQYEKAKNSIISSVDDILDNSYVGEIKDAFLDVRDAYSQILISDRGATEPGKISVRNVMESVLRPYVGLDDRDFVKVANRAVNDLFDWAVQTNKRVNTYLTNILLGSSTEESAAKQIMEFKKKVDEDPTHPLHDNYILNSLRIEEGDAEGKINNLYLADKSGKAYDQNLLIYGFRQLKDGMGESNKDLYGKLVRLAVLQSGLSNSPISFTTLLPYEDFETIYNDTLSNLGNLANLEQYYKLSVLQRNNASNTNIVPFLRSKLRQSKKNSKRWFNPNTTFIAESLKNAMDRGDIPKVINVSVFGKEGSSDFVTYQWELPISKEEKEKRKNKNRDHIKKGLFQKVYTTDENGKRVPLLQKSLYNGREYINFVYKQINAWGDSYRANEFYDYERPSVLDNGFEKVYKVNTDNKAESAEVEDKVIAKILYPSIAVEEEESDKDWTTENNESENPLDC